MEKIGFYAGSFDPFTNGHLHVVKGALAFCDYLVIGIGVNPNKKRRFDKDRMREAIIQVLKNEGLYEKVTVKIYSGMTTDFAIQMQASFLVRGLRNTMDYNEEETIAGINKEVSGLDTIYVRSGQFGLTSSSMVVELFGYGKDVTKYLSKEVFACMKKETIV